LRAILDEGVPIRLAQALAAKGCDVAPFPDGWKGLKNGELLEQIRTTGFGCLLTCDKNFRHQQNPRRWNLALVVLPKTRFEDLRPLLDHIVTGTEKAEPGFAVVIGADGGYVLHRGHQ